MYQQDQHRHLDQRADHGGEGHRRGQAEGGDGVGGDAAAVDAVLAERATVEGMPKAQLQKLIDDMTAQMGAAARELKFELAGRLRDEIYDLKKELRGMEEAGLE